MPRLFAFVLVVVALCCSPFSHPADAQSPLADQAFHPALLEAHLRFLASDALMGRRAGTPGNDAAARYLAEQFRLAGADTVSGADGFFQHVPLAHVRPPESTALTWEGQALEPATDFVVIEGGAADVEAPLVFAGYGHDADAYAGVDAEGKVVVVRAGLPGEQGPAALFQSGTAKRRLAAEHGARALVEVYDGPYPWPRLAGFLGRPRTGLDEGTATDLPHAWVRADEGTRLAAAEQEGASAHLQSSGTRTRRFTSSNVVARIPGSDAARREEHVVLLAHYDHVGAGMDRGMGATPADTIFNGARDNGMGLVALISAAHDLSASPPARSVLLLAVTAEEDGLLGSAYYTDHPLVPLEQTVYALNIDGAGYSDTTLVSLIGKGRTTADPLLTAAARAHGLTLGDDPAPEQGLFDRSDNVNFARRGVPAPTFAPGLRSFQDEAIATYYHRPADEVDAAFSFGYLQRFVRAYTHAARLLADAPQRPTWHPDDPYAEAGRALYGE